MQATDEKLSTSFKVENIKEINQGRYKVIEMLGKGSFGIIFRAYDSKSKNIVAIKVEKKTNSKIIMVNKEAKILAMFHGTGEFAQLFAYGQEPQFYYLVMTNFGANLEELMITCGGKFSHKTIIQISLQLLSIMKKLHDKGIIHRDVKPDNVVIGKTDPNKLYMIDFGLSKNYISKDGEHIPMTNKVGLVGTARYSSVPTHNFLEQSRRDDLESLAYTLIYLSLGKLPWMRVPGLTKNEKYHNIKLAKEKTRVSKLTRETPKGFKPFLKYVKRLEFNDKPDYTLIESFFMETVEKNDIELDGIMDWDVFFVDNHTSPFTNEQKQNESKVENGISSNEKRFSVFDTSKIPHLSAHDMSLITDQKELSKFKIEHLEYEGKSEIFINVEEPEGKINQIRDFNDIIIDFVFLCSKSDFPQKVLIHHETQKERFIKLLKPF